LLAALTSAESDSVQLSWTNSGPFAHKLYRSVDAGTFDLLASVDSLTQSVVDAGVPVGALCYRLAAVDSLGREGIVGDAVCLDVIGPLPDLLAAPTNVQAAWTEIAAGGTGVAIYEMNDGSGQLANDTAGSSLHAQLGAVATADAADPVWGAGVSGPALVFDGADDHLLVADDASLRIAGSFTIEAWVKRASAGDRHAILGKGDTNTSNYWLRYTKSGYIEFRWEADDGSDHGTQSSSPVTDTAWHHIAAVYDQTAGESRIYLDGVAIKVSGDSGTPVTTNDPLIIGARYSLGSMTNFFDGAIDAVRISADVAYDADFVPPTSHGSGGSIAVIDVTWEAPEGAVVGYQVYRQDQGGPWQPLLGEPITTLLYRDTDTVSDACYRIVAVDEYAREGTPSDA
jgi:hypothetical protein